MGASPLQPGDRFWYRGEPFTWLTEAPTGDRFWYQGEPALTASLSGDIILPRGIVSAEALGQPQIQLLLQIVSPAAIASSETFGEPLAELLLQVLGPVGVASAVSLGQPLVRLRPRLVPLGIPTATNFGQHSVNRIFLSSWDLRLESDLRSGFQEQEEEVSQRLGEVRPQQPAVQTVPQPPPPVTPAESLQDQAEQLKSSAALLEEHTVQLIEQVRLRAQALRFTVPPEDIATRTALLALHMNPEVVSFDDYLELLNLQINLAQQAGQHPPNETVIHAGGQIEIAVSFYENQLKNEISEASAWATQAKPLIKTRHTAEVIKNHLASYRDFPINNTIINALGGKASLADIIKDCIPCLERVLSLDGLNPFEQFLALLQSEIDRRWNYIQGLWNILNSRSLNLCDLLNYLNGLCIPDLFALLAILSYYWLQLMQILETNVWKLIWSLIQPLLQSLLCGLEGILERFIRLLLAPVECIITSIDHEYSKIYNLGRALSKEFWVKGPQATKPYDHTVEKWAKENILNPILYGVGPYGFGLLELKRALINARDMINGQLKRLQDAIKEALGIDADALGTSQGLFLILRWLALIIGLVKAIIRFKQAGYSCKPEGLDKNQYRILVEYLNETTKVPFVVTPTSPTTPPFVFPPVTPGQTSPEDAASELLKELLQYTDTGGPLSRGSAEAVDTSPGYTLPDCVAQRSQLEAAKVAVWTRELDELVP